MLKVKAKKDHPSLILEDLDRVDNTRRVLDAEIRKGVRSLSELITCLDTVQNLHARLKEIATDMNSLADHLSTQLVPEAMQAAGFTTVNHAVGRVTVASRVSASMLDKAAGLSWLRSHDLGDLIIETVNHQTLSAQAKTMLEAGDELPAEIFKTSLKTYTSITRPGAKRTRKFREED